MIVLICRFGDAAADFAERARGPVELLAAQPTCLSLRLARSTDVTGLWVLTAEFPTFAGYRQALGPFDVRTTVIPFLSTADQHTSGVYEVAVSGELGKVARHELLVDP